MRIGDLQGTMIDEERMISVENLTLILIAAGTIAGAKRGTNGSTGLRGQMERTVGGAEVGRGASGFLPFGMPLDRDAPFPVHENFLEKRCCPFRAMLLAMICTMKESFVARLGYYALVPRVVHGD